MLIQFLEVNSCDCYDTKKLDIARQIEYDNSDIVILGEVIYVSNDLQNFKIKVLENYKGKLVEDQIVEGENHLYCFPNANKKGLWLIYGRIENGKLKPNACGLSRSLNSPNDNRYFMTPPPRPIHPDSIIVVNAEEKAKLEEKYMKRKEKYKQMAIKELNVELKQLREKNK